MGFMDKAKEAALQAKQKSQQLAQQGQAKVQTMQQGRSEAELLRALGEAYYAQTRHSGDPAAVATALAALDEHYASASDGASTGGAATDGAPTDGAPTGGAATGGATFDGGTAGAPESTPPPPAGNFTLDNL
jgi:hypothetical protein